jgi:hypothetical protein
MSGPEPSVNGPLILLEGSIIPVVEGMFKEGISRHALAPGFDAAIAVGGHGRLGRLRSCATLVSDTRPHSRRGDGRQD